MIVTEAYGENFIKTYSNAGVKIERDGRLFDEAIDPVGTNRQYTETDIPVPSSDYDDGSPQGE